MAVGPQRETATTVRARARMTGFKMRFAAPRKGNEPPCLVVRIQCSVRMSAENRLVGGITRRFDQERREEAARRFTVQDPAVLRSEAACHAAVRRMLPQVPQLAEYYGHRAAEVQLWDGCVPPGLVAGIVREVAAGGAHRSYVCDVWMHVDFVSVYSEAKALLLSCEGAAARARAGGDIVARGAGQCAICMEELLGEADGVMGLPGCSHAFHRGCTLKWFQRAATCPSCRRDMMQYLPEINRLWHMLE